MKHGRGRGISGLMGDCSGEEDAERRRIERQQSDHQGGEEREVSRDIGAQGLHGITCKPSACTRAPCR